MRRKTLFVAWLIAFCPLVAGGFPFVPGAQQSGWPVRSELLAELENNRGQLALNLTNHTGRELRLKARISLGTETEMKEVGMVDFRLLANQTVIYGLTGAAPSGTHYILAIYREEKLLFYKHAPLRGATEGEPTAFLSLLPARRAGATTNTTGNPASTVAAAPTEARPAEMGNFVPPPEVQLQARLLADEKENETFVLSFDLHAERPIYQATFAISLGKFKDSKPVSINRQSLLQFKLPEVIEEEQVQYTLTAKDGRLLLKGELLLSKLMEEDFVTVNDIRLDQAGYSAGETVRLLTILDGKTQHGYRIEIAVRDGRGNFFHRDQRLVPPDSQEPAQEFSFTLPAQVAGPIIVEYRVFDAQSGTLYDSGEREIPLAP